MTAEKARQARRYSAANEREKQAEKAAPERLTARQRRRERHCQPLHAVELAEAEHPELDRVRTLGAVPVSLQ